MNETTQPPLDIQVSPTPNPNCTKFTLNRTLAPGNGHDFPSLETALRSPLAKELFSIPGVCGVFIGAEFVTVTVNSGTEWRNFPEAVKHTLERFIASGKPA